MDIQNDATFVAPEGVYSLTDEFKSPSISAGAATAASMTQFPTKVSIIVVKYPIGAKPVGFQVGALWGAGKDKEREKEKEKELDKTSLSSTSEKSKTDEDTPDTNTDSSPHHQHHHSHQPQPPTPPQLPANSLFAPAATSLTRAKSVSKPKHNIRTTSSSFVTRIQSMESLNKHLASRQGDITYVFYNHARSFFWNEITAKTKEPLARLTFSHPATCHSINPSTASPQGIDVVIGFSTGDIIWFDPISSRYVRVNKAGAVTTSCVTAIKWVKGTASLFVTAHRDGCMIIWERDRDDPASTWGEKLKDWDSEGSGWNSKTSIIITTPPWHVHTPSLPNHTGTSLPSVGSASTQASFAVPMSPTMESATSSEFPTPLSPSLRSRDKPSKNPLSHWRISSRAILDFTFSPTMQHIAAVCEDGCLRVIDAANEKLVDCYSSYFGALTCVAWSPDGRYVITGGQDDLLTIYSPYDARVIARCQGHTSFVTSIAFDEQRCLDGRIYRFGSVGEDGRCILWDFSSTALHRPKHQHHSSTFSQAHLRSTLSLARDTMHADAENEGKYHPTPPRNEVPVLESVVVGDSDSSSDAKAFGLIELPTIFQVKQIDSETVSHISFTDRAVLTCTRGGHIKCWVRPFAPSSSSSPRRRGSGSALITSNGASAGAGRRREASAA